MDTKHKQTGQLKISAAMLVGLLVTITSKAGGKQQLATDEDATIHLNPGDTITIAAEGDKEWLDRKTAKAERIAKAEKEALTGTAADLAIKGEPEIDSTGGTVVNTSETTRTRTSKTP